MSATAVCCECFLVRMEEGWRSAQRGEGAGGSVRNTVCTSDLPRLVFGAASPMRVDVAWEASKAGHGSPRNVDGAHQVQELYAAHVWHTCNTQAAPEPHGAVYCVYCLCWRHGVQDSHQLIMDLSRLPEIWSRLSLYEMGF